MLYGVICMPISVHEFYEYKDDNWKDKVFKFLNENKETPTPAFEITEITQAIAPANMVTADASRRTEWALEDLVYENKVVKTKIMMNGNYYYMVK